MLELYKRIRQLRQDKGMSQQELAEKTGYTDRSSIAKIEKGDVDLTESKIQAFADALGVRPSYLMGWDDDEVQFLGHHDNYYLDEDARVLAEFLYNNPEYKTLFDASRKVKPEDLEFVRQMIERMGGTD